MTDVSAVLRTFLLTNGPLVDLISNRLWAETDVPIAGYTPAQGGAIAFRVRGGLPSASDALLVPSFQFKCYGVSAVQANAVYRALYVALDGTRRGGLVRWAQCEVLGQTLSEPDLGSGAPWWFVVTFFRVWIVA